MLPRRNSIFHLQEEEEEEEEEEARKIKESAIRDQSGSAKLWQPETKIEGLRLLIHSSGGGYRNNVVIKCSSKSSSSSSSSKASPLMSFLKACSFCKRELCPHKDVYMYRGDQGFCSEECRRRQILRDERKEVDAILMRERSKASPPHRRRQIVSKPHPSDRQRKVLAAA